MSRGIIIIKKSVCCGCVVGHTYDGKNREATMTARIGELLVRGGFATDNHISEALQMQKRKKKKIGEILVELGYVDTDDLDRMLSEQAAMRNGLKFRHWPFIP